MEHFFSSITQAIKIVVEGKPTTKVLLQFKAGEKELMLEFRVASTKEIEDASCGSTMIAIDPNIPEGLEEMIFNKYEDESGEPNNDTPKTF